MSDREHLTDEASVECWCNPEILVPCPEDCEKGSNCWRCEGRGLIICETCVLGGECDEAHVIVHRETP